MTTDIRIDDDLDLREELTYEGFGIAIRELATSVHGAGFRPDWLVSIARGGLVVGGALAYAMGHKNVATVNVEFYTGVDARLDVPVELPPVLNLDDIANRSVLIVDDVADTGETLRLVVDKCRSAASEVRSAVLYEKSRSIIRADFVWKRTDQWINFPWSTLPVIGTDAEAS